MESQSNFLSLLKTKFKKLRTMTQNRTELTTLRNPFFLIHSLCIPMLYEIFYNESSFPAKNDKFEADFFDLFFFKYIPKPNEP